MYTNDEPKDNNKKRVFKIITFSGLIISVIVISFLVYTKSRGLDIENMDVKSVFAQIFTIEKSSGGILWERTYNFEDEHILGISKDMLLKYKDSSIVGINRNGENELNLKASLNNPITSFSGNRFAVGDKEGHSIYVLNGKKVVWKKELNDRIINIYINAGGYAAVVHDAKGYSSAVSVYDPGGEWIFTRDYSETYAFSASISEDNASVLVNCMDVGGINAFTYIEVLDILGTRMSGFDKDKLFPYACFVDKDSLFLANDNELYFYDSGGKQIAYSAFEEIYSVAAVSGKYAAASVISEKKSGVLKSYNIDILIFDEHGEKNASIGLKEEVYNLRSYEDIIAVNTGRQVIFLDEDCNEIYRFSSISDIRDVFFLNRMEAVVVSKNKVSALRLANNG